MWFLLVCVCLSVCGNWLLIRFFFSLLRTCKTNRAIINDRIIASHRTHRHTHAINRLPKVKTEITRDALSLLQKLHSLIALKSCYADRCLSHGALCMWELKKKKTCANIQRDIDFLLAVCSTENGSFFFKAITQRIGTHSRYVFCYLTKLILCAVVQEIEKKQNWK